MDEHDNRVVADSEALQRVPRVSILSRWKIAGRDVAVRYGGASTLLANTLCGAPELGGTPKMAFQLSTVQPRNAYSLSLDASLGERRISCCSPHPQEVRISLAVRSLKVMNSHLMPGAPTTRRKLDFLETLAFLSAIYAPM